MNHVYKSIIITLILLVSVENYLYSAPAHILDKELYAWSHSIAEAFHVVNTKSYFPISGEQAIKALDAFVHLDDYSHFLGPKDYKKLIEATEGTFYGIGVKLGFKRAEDDFLLILDIVPGSPAYNKGLQRYDKIIAIDGNSVVHLSVDEAINKLKGEKRYSLVKVDVIRNGKNSLSFNLERDIIKEEHMVCHYLPQHHIAYCALSSFTQRITRRLEATLKRVLAKKPKAIILDLRDNGGGVLQEAVECAGLFLPYNSLIVSTKNRDQKLLDQLHTKRDPLITHALPIFILINNYTASTAEILAGALKIHPYIFLIGTKTYGKGSVQEIIPMSNNCALKITTCICALPDNNGIQEQGITPDFIIDQKYPPSPEIKLLTHLYGKERNTKKESPPLSSSDTNKDPHIQKIDDIKNDYQIQCAMNLALLLNIALTTDAHKLTTHQQAYTWLKKHFISYETAVLEEIAPPTRPNP
jgi:carboxyl-terminal processing protease